MESASFERGRRVPAMLIIATLAGAVLPTSRAAMTPIPVTATGDPGGSLTLSRKDFTSGDVFTVDQSAPNNAGMPLRIDLSGAADGWSCAYACPTGACDAVTYAVLRARTTPAETGQFTVTCASSPFQTQNVPFGVVGVGASDAFTFTRRMQNGVWAYGISLITFAITAGVSLAVVSRA
jgi:hypothetical protein